MAKDRTTLRRMRFAVIFLCLIGQVITALGMMLLFAVAELFGTSTWFWGSRIVAVLFGIGHLFVLRYLLRDVEKEFG